MTITPDTKNWTWVLERPCPDCGFDAPAFDHDEMPVALRANAIVWQAVLQRADVQDRPAPEVWSALEYACHVRDVFRIFDVRLGLMLSEDDPTFPNWDQDATAVEESYREQDPDRVAAEIAVAAEQLATRFEEVAGDQWTRPGTRSNGSRFTVDSMARYALHDLVHHVSDVGADHGV